MGLVLIGAFLPPNVHDAEIIHSEGRPDILLLSSSTADTIFMRNKEYPDKWVLFSVYLDKIPDETERQIEKIRIKKIVSEKK